MATQVEIPINLLTYKPQQQTTALCWQINPESIVDLSLLDFKVEIDVVNTFDSINKKVYTKDNVVNYQDGTFFKAFVINDPLLFETQNYFWRVKVESEDYISEWSDYSKKNISSLLDGLEYNIPTKIRVIGEETDIVIQKTIKENVAMFDTVPASSTLIDGIYERYTKEDFLSLLDTQYGITDNVYEYVGPQEYNIKNITWYEDTETAENLLPDNYVYTKTGNTNIKRIIEMYMRLIGVFKNEVIQVANNYNYKKTQDKDLYDILGCLIDYTRNIDEPFITYKYELYNLWQAYLHQGTTEAFNIIISALYGVLPEIKSLKEENLIPYVYNNVLLSNTNLATEPSENMPPTNFNIGTKYYDNNTNKILECINKASAFTIKSLGNATHINCISSVYMRDVDALFNIYGCNNGKIIIENTNTDSIQEVTLSFPTGYNTNIIDINIIATSFVQPVAYYTDLAVIACSTSSGIVFFNFEDFTYKYDTYIYNAKLIQCNYNDNSVIKNYTTFAFDGKTLTKINMDLINKDLIFSDVFAFQTQSNDYKLLFSKYDGSQYYVLIYRDGHFYYIVNSTLNTLAFTCDNVIYFNIEETNNVFNLYSIKNNKIYKTVYNYNTLIETTNLLFPLNLNYDTKRLYIENNNLMFGIGSTRSFIYNNGELIDPNLSCNITNTNFDSNYICYGGNNVYVLDASLFEIKPTWKNAIEYEPSVYDNYQIQSQGGLSNYHYTLINNPGQTFAFGEAENLHYYVRNANNEEGYEPNPYLYTNQYLAHNLVINVTNIYDIQLDEKIVLEILNNLKPLNVNIILNIIED